MKKTVMILAILLATTNSYLYAETSSDNIKKAIYYYKHNNCLQAIELFEKEFI